MYVTYVRDCIRPCLYLQNLMYNRCGRPRETTASNMGELLYGQCSSFQSLNSEQLNKTPDIDNMVEAGFEFTGNGTFRCKTCDVSLACWKQTDDVWKEHARYSPQCAYLQQKKGPAYIESVQAVFTTEIFTPKSPQHSELDARELTYSNPNWPAQHVRIAQEKLAKASFFYTGKEATVRCHYCDISLNCLEPHTEPWANHALLSPCCKYLIKMKGVDFVENFTATKDIGLPVSPVSLDPSTPVRILTSMAYSYKVITEAIDQYASKTGANDFRVGDLLCLISNIEGGDEVVEDQHDMPSYGEVEEMNQGLLCRICVEQPVTTLLLPCFHLYVCKECADGIAICPDCNRETTPVSSPVHVLGRSS
ncbi:baculoviral IAP repeat-containing protein 8-like [Mizuhopecten yessoensis]|uniref:baculoviral IAP repeat-containing protein 8-like n=1 Tax=Mizuhopecten yessoensis TaxID=6573 RepID=UPI000B45757D|nr:baculoviral IAP repeat-containing protein 8-like [Mizuhopecten yessoensis]